MLAAECYEGMYGRIVAAFDVGAEKLPPLRQADSIDRRSFGKSVVHDKIMADLCNLLCHIAQESCGAIRGGTLI